MTLEEFAEKCAGIEFEIPRFSEPGFDLGEDGIIGKIVGYNKIGLYVIRSRGGHGGVITPIIINGYEEAVRTAQEQNRCWYLSLESAQKIFEKMKIKRKTDICPKCEIPGVFRLMALKCPRCGYFIGGC